MGLSAAFAKGDVWPSVHLWKLIVWFGGGCADRGLEYERLCPTISSLAENLCLLIGGGCADMGLVNGSVCCCCNGSWCPTICSLVEISCLVGGEPGCGFDCCCWNWCLCLIICSFAFWTLSFNLWGMSTSTSVCYISSALCLASWRYSNCFVNPGLHSCFSLSISRSM